jgi:hypothetical protein
MNLKDAKDAKDCRQNSWRPWRLRVNEPFSIPRRGSLSFSSLRDESLGGLMDAQDVSHALMRMTLGSGCVLRFGMTADLAHA